MSTRVSKSLKCCASCKYWCGEVKDVNSSYVEVLSNTSDKFTCSSRNGCNRNQKVDYQKRCSYFEPRFN